MQLTEILAAVRWWVVLMILGAVATPLLYVLLRPLPDRGYAFSKMAGLLLVGYLFWLAGSLGFLGNNVGGILLALGVVGAASFWIYSRLPTADRRLLAWLRENKWHVLTTELVFALIFALWVWVRAQNPTIAATEKPMEFAFLNALGRSSTFPPVDPWLSGYAISYYYFGYVMVSLIARLAIVAEPVAFNLGIAWLVAGTAVGAYGLVYNLVATRDFRRHAMLFGLLAALALPIAGNMQMALEVLHGNGVGSAGFWRWLDVRDINEPAVVVSALGGADSGSAPADIRSAPTPRYLTSSWWWWRTSRVIHEYHLSGQAEEGLEPIVEVPSFSFILGDMHPHVLALPFSFLSLAVAYSWWLVGVQRSRDDEVTGWQGDKVTREHPLTSDAQHRPPPHLITGLLAGVGWQRWLFTCLVLGGLSFLNTWDVLIHLFVVLGAFFLSRWYTQGWHRRLLSATLWLALALAIPAFLLYLPFYLGFSSQAGPPFLLPMLMRPTRLAHYLIIFLMPLLPITILLFSLATRQRFRHWRSGLAAAAFLFLGLLLLMGSLGIVVASTAEGASRVSNLASELNVVLPPRPEQSIAVGWALPATFTLGHIIAELGDQIIAVSWGLQATFALLPTILSARLLYPGLTLFLLLLLALIIMVWRGEEAQRQIQPSAFIPSIPSGQALQPSHPALPFVLLLIFTGVLLTLAPEFVYLRDNFGLRLNTTFKFYYQAWVMLGVTAVYALAYLWRAGHLVAAEGGVRWVMPALTTAAYVTALAIALLFPIYAVRSRAIEFRGPVTSAGDQASERQPPTLNGLAHIQRFNPAEYDAIMWLRQNVSGTPVILEAVGGQYSEFGRVSANTGLPTLLGWPGHEWQWRGSDHPEPGQRDPLVRTIYSETDLSNVASWLDQYGVEYIYAGDLEANTYGLTGLEKFRDRLAVAYANDRVTIYRWQPSG
jgi:YYY domain-containing protein